ncbi:hypothetical protein BJY04DRAFT_199764 [Aspergillus karnatakaensis]|uniref:uncharacterized protein n=1 Tax=Aspergillus karnatakaensis TaxID=1810916 RepID=UPI003CCE1F7B
MNASSTIMARLMMIRWIRTRHPSPRFITRIASRYFNASTIYRPHKKVSRATLAIVAILIVGIRMGRKAGWTAAEPHSTTNSGTRMRTDVTMIIQRINRSRDQFCVRRLTRE